MRKVVGERETKRVRLYAKGRKGESEREARERDEESARHQHTTQGTTNHLVLS